MTWPGQTTLLPDVLAREPVPIGTLAQWGAELAGILAAAHAGGAVHGDVRAEAVAIAAGGVAHLDGFGERPATGPKHPAPEFDQGAEPSPASDVYALGTVLRQAGGHADPVLLQLCAWMRHDDPGRRPGAAEVADRLVQFAQQPRPATWAPGIAAPGPGGPVRRRRGSRTIIAVAVVAVTLLAAAGGWWLLSPSPPVPPVAASDPIGDPRTADPCALLDTSALEGFGPTELYPDLGSVAGCTVAIRPAAGEIVSVHAALEGIRSRGDRDLAPLPQQRAGEITIYHPSLGPGSCARTVLLPNRSRVTFSAASNRDGGGLDPCTVADTAVLQVLPRLTSGSLPRRTLAGPPNSLAWVDHCTLLDDATLRSIPGLRVDARDSLNGGTVCEWGDDDPGIADPPLVSVYASRTGSVSGKSISINSREGAIRPTIAKGPRVYCRVSLIQRSFPGPSGEPLYELLNVQVHLTVATAADAQCAVATEIAEIATAKLPPPG